MNAKATSKAVPALRFPEFRDAPEWEVKQLSEVLTYERPDEFIVSDTKYKASGMPVLTANKSFILGYTDEEHGIYENLPAIIFDDFTTDKKYVDFPFKVKSSAIKILKAKERNSPKTLYEIMNQIKFDPKGHKRYYISEYQNLVIFLPREQEQQKIADCLSAIDELIATSQRQIETLKKHKKGMMQQLFPAEGETQPKLRFPEFRSAPAWEKKALAQLAHVIAGQSPKGKSYNSVGDGTPFYQGKTDFGKILLNKPTKWTTEVTKLACQGDILMSVRAPVGALNIATEEICIGRGLASIQAKGNKWFLFYYLKRIEHSITGSGGAIFDSITKKQIDSIDVCIPMTAIEQQKIADCLSAIDELIATQSKKVEALKEHKRGMMQQLFPTPEDKG